MKVTAQQLHYGLCVLATLACIGRYVLGTFDVGFGAWVIAFWGVAVANDRLNTPTPTGVCPRIWRTSPPPSSISRT